MLGVGWLISHNKSKVVSTMPCRIPSETGVGALEACNTLSIDYASHPGLLPSCAYLWGYSNCKLGAFPSSAPCLGWRTPTTCGDQPPIGCRWRCAQTSSTHHARPKSRLRTVTSSQAGPYLEPRFGKRSGVSKPSVANEPP